MSLVSPDLSHTTLAEKTRSRLQEAILLGEFEPGQRLQVDELARWMGTSPMPVREALRDLHAVGLVEVIPYKGARVAGLSKDDLRDLYDVRLALESLAVRRAAERFTAEQEESARGALREYIEVFAGDDIAEAWRAGVAYHLEIYAASGSERLVRQIRPLMAQGRRYHLRWPPPLDRKRRRLSERLLEACVQHDPESAEQQLRELLTHGQRYIAAKLEDEEPADRAT